MEEREDIVYGISEYFGPYEGWQRDIVTTSKRRAWNRYRELLTDPAWSPATRLRILVWRDGVVSDVLLESGHMTDDWKRIR